MIEFHTTWRKSSYSGPDANCVEVAVGVWRKSSYSGGDANCVEVAVGTWRKSSHSAEDANCVEIAHGVEVAGIRDSKNPDGPFLAFSVAAYRELISRTAS